MPGDVPTGRLRAVTAASITLLVVLLPACSSGPDSRSQTVPKGDVTLGREAMVEYGCGSCHRIPGVRGADALVGPPLDAFGERSYVAGSLPNNQENLVRWITDPDEVEPGTAMPDLGVSEDEAVNISAYLLTLD